MAALTAAYLAALMASARFKPAGAPLTVPPRFSPPTSPGSRAAASEMTLRVGGCHKCSQPQQRQGACPALIRCALSSTCVLRCCSHSAAAGAARVCVGEGALAQDTLGHALAVRVCATCVRFRGRVDADGRAWVGGRGRVRGWNKVL